MDTNFEEFYLDFTATVMRQNYFIGIPFYYLLRTDAFVNYNVDWNSHEEKLNFCANLWGQAFNDDAETIYNIVVQYVHTYETGGNTVSCHTKSNNRQTCYIELKLNFKTEAYEGGGLQRPIIFYKVHIMMEIGSSD